MRAFFAFAFIFLLLASVVFASATDAIPSQEKRSEDAAFDAKKKMTEFPTTTSGLKKPGAGNPASLKRLAYPVLAFDYYKGSFEGSVAAAFDLKTMQSSFRVPSEKSGDRQEHEKNALTDYLSSIRLPSGWPYLRAYVDSENAKDYRYEILALSPERKEPSVMVPRTPLLDSHRIPLDVVSNLRVDAETYTLASVFTGKASERKNVAFPHAPLPDFSIQAPKYLQRLGAQFKEDGWKNPQWWIADSRLPEFSAAYTRKENGKTRNIYAMLIWDEARPADGPLCNFVFVKAVGKKTEYSIGGDRERVLVPDSYQAPDCPFQTLTLKEISLFEKAMRQMQAGKSVAFVPYSCEKSATAFSGRLFIAYEGRGSKLLATNLESGEIKIVELEKDEKAPQVFCTGRVVWQKAQKPLVASRPSPVAR